MSFGTMPDLNTCDPAVKAQWKEAQLEMFTIGVPHSPTDFIEKAFEVGRPRGFDFMLEPAIHEAIKANFVRAPYHLAKVRIDDFVKKWTDRARALQPDENQLHAKMPPYLAKVLSGKRLLLMAEMMREAKCPDESLIQDISRAGSVYQDGCLDPVTHSPMSRGLPCLWTPCSCWVVA